MLLTLAVLSFAFVMLAAITYKAWRGDGRTDLRRCPRCWYDLSAGCTLRCPECGHAADTEADLYRRRYSRRAVGAGAAGMSLLLVAGVYLALPGPWTAKVPRPLLRLMLTIAAPPPTPASPNTGAHLLTPNAALNSSRSPWDRLVWQHQADLAFEAWAAAVLASEGPITDPELARLVPLADEAHALFMQTGSLPWLDFHLLRTRDRLAAARTAAAGHTDRLLRIEWALAELQYSGGGYSHRRDFARTPDAIILAALDHPDPAVRSFGIARLGRRMHAVVMDRSNPVPAGREIVEKLATADPHPSVRSEAARLVSYMDGFLPKR